MVGVGSSTSRRVLASTATATSWAGRNWIVALKPLCAPLNDTPTSSGAPMCHCHVVSYQPSPSTGRTVAPSVASSWTYRAMSVAEAVRLPAASMTGT